MKAVIKVRTTNLSEIAEAFENNVKKDSNYRTIQRFFSDFNFSYTTIAKLLLSFIPLEKYVVCIDRTTWEIGNKKINFLVLSVEYKGIGIPIFWNELGKSGGNSNTKERKDLLEDFVNVFGKDKIKALLADREFIGEEWFSWLEKEEIPFMIRIKSNFFLNKEKGGKSHAKNFFNKYSEKSIQKELFGLKLKIIGLKLSKTEYLIVATNMSEVEIKYYKKRWSIETMFSYFKKRGFDLEATKMDNPKKLEKLIALLSLTFCWCFTVGIFFHKAESKFRKDLGYFSKSIFKVGLDYIRSALLNPVIKEKNVDKSISILCRQLLGFKDIVVE